jgi:hypothetical protein
VVSYIGVCKDGDAQKILSDAKLTLSIVLRQQDEKLLGTTFAREFCFTIQDHLQE